MRPYGSQKTLARRRQRAVALLERGWTLSEVARHVSATCSSVHKWRQAWQTGGATALQARPVPGRPHKLAPVQQERLWEILLNGALKYGFPNELWTLKRIAKVIRNEFGVTYHPGHVWKLLRRDGWSCQVPERRAIQRDEQAIAHWKRYKLPALKKSPETVRASGVH